MMRLRSDNPYAMMLLILVQIFCAGFFLWDVVIDSGELRALLPLDIHFAIEALAVIGLISAAVFETRFVLRLLARKAHLERQVSLAASALHDVIEEHFRSWALTAAETDVAWFTVKGFGIAQIAEFRGSAEGTVKSHLNAIYRKAGVGNRGELLSLLIEGLMAGDDTLHPDPEPTGSGDAIPANLGRPAPIRQDNRP